MVANPSPSPEPAGPEQSAEEQLVTYASDLRRLFRERQTLQLDASHAKQFGELRGKELTALNSLVQQWLTGLFELEEEYELLLEQLEKIAQAAQPNETKESIQEVVRRGRLRLQRSREGDSSKGPSSSAEQ